MNDFLGKPLSIDDKVIFIYDKFKTNELKEGVITKLNIKQGNYNMVEVQWIDNNRPVTSRVSLKKIFKL